MTELPFKQTRPAMINKQTVENTLLAAKSLGDGAEYTADAVTSILKCYVIAMNALLNNDPRERLIVLVSAGWIPEPTPAPTATPPSTTGGAN